MGSSAAVIAATFVLYEHLLSHTQSPEERFERVRFCERLQHGQGSVIDAACVVHSGLNRVDEGQLSLYGDHQAAQSLQSGWYWIFHGTPLSLTGECVAEVARQHANDQTLWQDFAACTNALQHAISNKGCPKQAIRENHRLLSKISVVPDLAQQLIRELEAAGAAAKISGAGAVRGDRAGIILVYAEDNEAFAALMAKHPELRWEALQVASQGAHLLPDSTASEDTPPDPITA